MKSTPPPPPESWTYPDERTESARELFAEVIAERPDLGGTELGTLEHACYLTSAAERLDEIAHADTTRELRRSRWTSRLGSIRTREQKCDSRNNCSARRVPHTNRPGGVQIPTPVRSWRVDGGAERPHTDLATDALTELLA